MAPKKAAGKPAGKEKPGGAAAAKMMAAAGPPKPRKIPPPPACFNPEDLARFKECFKTHDEEGTEKIPLNLIPLMLRKLGFNPKTAEVKEMFRLFLEDDLVDTVEYFEFLQMIEAKVNWGDDVENTVTKAFAALSHDDDEVGICDFNLLREELEQWGEPLSDIEFVDWIKLSLKDKTLTIDGAFNYVKFIENMNAKDTRFSKEPVNFFKLDQKTLYEMALKKAAEEKAEQDKKDAEKAAREEAKRLRMIAEGLIIE